MISEKSMPLYMQIKEDLKYKILNETWKVGERIPSEDELLGIYGVSRITITKAMRELESEKIVFRKSGKGTYVRDWKEADYTNTNVVTSLTNEMLSVGKKIVTLDATIEEVRADERIAKLLNVAKDSRVLILKRIRAVDDNDIIAYSINTFPYIEGLSTKSSDYYGSFYEYLRKFNIYFTYNREYLEAVACNKTMAKKLGIKENDPLLRSTKLCKTVEENFSEYNVCYFIGEKYKYYVK